MSGLNEQNNDDLDDSTISGGDAGGLDPMSGGFDDIDDSCWCDRCDECDSIWLYDPEAALAADTSPGLVESISRLKRITASGHFENVVAARLNLGYFYEQLTEYDEALRWYRKAARSGVAEVETLAMMGIGMIYYQQGRVDKALHWLNKATRTNNLALSVDAEVLHGMVKLQTTDLPEQHHAEPVLSINPTPANIFG